MEIHSKPVVVAYGLMSSGKSSLLNMLTGHVREEFFMANDVFEGERYVFVDTPGVDASVEETGAGQADIALFVHEPQGELEAIELEFLSSLAASFGPFASKRVLIVLTMMEKDESARIDAIEHKIRVQCEAVLGFMPPIFQVSNKRYQNGVLKQQRPMIVLSRIPALADYLQNLADAAGEPRTQRASQRNATLTMCSRL